MNWSEQHRDTTGDVAYTYDWYRRFLTSLIRAGFDFRDYDADLGPGEAIPRHDIDLSPSRALTTARIEAELDVTGTYFFLVSTPIYNPLYERTRAVIEEISDLGHDVGLHFSTHQYWGPADDPDESAIEERVIAERETLSTVVPTVDAVSFHIPPDWVLGRRFEGFESTYEPRFFQEIEYVADSNQRWRELPPPLDDIGEKIQVLVHPGLWGESDASFEERVEQSVDGSNVRAANYAEGRYIEQRYG